MAGKVSLQLPILHGRHFFTVYVPLVYVSYPNLLLLQNQVKYYHVNHMLNRNLYVRVMMRVIKTENNREGDLSFSMKFSCRQVF